MRIIINPSHSQKEESDLIGDVLFSGMREEERVTFDREIKKSKSETILAWLYLVEVSNVETFDAKHGSTRSDS